MFQLTNAFPYEKNSSIFLCMRDTEIIGFAKILDEKKLYKNDGLGHMKQFTAKCIVDFMFQDNDLFDDRSDAR